jgi:DNA-binding GntR family transcriptional regulator
MEDAPAHDPRTYIQIAAAIRGQITSGHLQPGKPIPSITVLAREYGTSRGTAGKAVRLIEREGMIFRVPGLGYHVSSEPAVPHIDEHGHHQVIAVTYDADSGNS